MLTKQITVYRKSPKDAASGFSMVELMIVLVIVGILVLLALPRLEPLVNKAKEDEADA